MQQPEDKPKIVKISTCLPTNIWEALVVHLRKPYSRAEPGKLDRGDLAAWILEQAHATLANKGYTGLLEQFIAEKELKAEFEAFYQQNINLL